MIRHIVLWSLPANDPEKAVHAQEIKDLLEGLIGQIPSIRHLEVGINLPETPETNWDVALFSEFEDRAGLEAYQSHPAHQAGIPRIKSLVSGRTCVDYEV
ncbi:MAG: Dabb family protein [Bacteroidetes Order II. Incertae sedis bacterium]|nr:Dabb family protein [Bacteroidetes Order II. bacterium]